MTYIWNVHGFHVITYMTTTQREDILWFLNSYQFEIIQLYYIICFMHAFNYITYANGRFVHTDFVMITRSDYYRLCYILIITFLIFLNKLFLG